MACQHVSVTTGQHHDTSAQHAASHNICMGLWGLWEPAPKLRTFSAPEPLLLPNLLQSHRLENLPELAPEPAPDLELAPEGTGTCCETPAQQLAPELVPESLRRNLLTNLLRNLLRGLLRPAPRSLLRVSILKFHRGKKTKKPRFLSTSSSVGYSLRRKSRWSSPSSLVSKPEALLSPDVLRGIGSPFLFAQVSGQNLRGLDANCGRQSAAV